MSSASLTAKYRPQTFADVAGQETIKAILSRAAQEDKVAPAYLLSGTRGVGKTTIARIFAKALNCVNAPVAEPCNECEHCRKITLGNHVDVVEIDGASNRGIEDARRLREAIGYAPMEGRYKVFIIDEAHMLTREAFNALLKTLEEPPAKVTFIMATTESHKFPVTIVSRCQHYTYKRLSEQELDAHLTRILELEQKPFESSAVKLIARRGAGSVRDSMSLLGQVLALGDEKLEVATVRSILGLAGQELFFSVMEAIKAQDVLAVSSVIRSILDQGVDIGFFLRELAATWRNLFMLKQAGEAALPLLDLPEDEARQWLEWAPQFELSHIHASWQLTLEGQRRVLTSLEPAMALELLLLNLAFLPRLLSMEALSSGGTGGADAPASPAQRSSSGVSGRAQPSQGAPQGMGNAPYPSGAAQQSSVVPPHRQQGATGGAGSSGPAGPSSGMTSPPPWVTEDIPPGGDGETNIQPPAPESWEGFLLHCKEQNGEGGRVSSVLRSVKGELSDGLLTIRSGSSLVYDQLVSEKALLDTRAKEFYGDGTAVLLQEPDVKVRPFSELKMDIESDPVVQLIMEEFNASLQDYGPLNDPRRESKQQDEIEEE